MLIHYSNYIYTWNAEKNITIEEIESELNQKTQEFDDLSKEYNTLLSNYRSITNSIWWKIPTKIINFFRRFCNTVSKICF